MLTIVPPLGGAVRAARGAQNSPTIRTSISRSWVSSGTGRAGSEEAEHGQVPLHSR
jgi:hypothetical protein